VRRLRYLASARRDISDIYHYIESRTESSVTAQRFVDRLRAQCRHIAALPSTLGRPRPELGKDLRTFPFQGYLIVLRYADDVLEIVDIVEGHRDIKAIIRKEY
jgi:plasmid stabilization system protein ParE